MLNEWINKLKSLDVNEIYLETVKSLEKEIIRLNQEQMYTGKYEDGNRIQPDYKEMTKVIKEGKSQPTDRVTLKDTGDFYSGMAVEYANEYFIIYSKDKKMAKLVNKYSWSIFGLTDENLNDFIWNFFYESFMTKFREAFLP